MAQDRDRILERQRAAASRLACLIGGVSEAALRRAPGPGKWSVVEVIAHLAEDELSSTWRYRQMLEHPGVELTAFDQNLWAQWGDYARWEIGEALALYRLLREANIRFLSRLTTGEWTHWGTHRERGRMTIGELAAHMCDHDERHFTQIERGIVRYNVAG
ncbi:MAG: DinB family protein [Candidatus Solibacter sp.]